MRTTDLVPTRLPDRLRDTQRLLFIAKHARWTGGLHPDDGNHALYHRETREILEALRMPIVVADDYADLFVRPEVDFVFPLLNRGGFFNSEMLLPLLCNRLGLPYVGASPIVRGLSDDKHLTKLEAAARGIPTAAWSLFRRGAPVDVARCPPARRWVIKPNNSSASWGIRDAHDRIELARAIAEVLALDHDAIVGLCIRALRDCAAGTILDRFAGEIGPQVSQHSLQVRDGQHISNTRFIGYLSHGCDPNCRLDMASFELVTLRPIAANERVTIDYATTEDQLHVQFACSCGASTCRGWITGRNDPVSESGRRHLAAQGACPADL